MRLRSRPLRTYSRRDGFLRLLPPPPRWLSPPLNRRNLFSSSSAASPALSAATSASSSAAPDDPDYSPPHKRCPWSGSDSPVRAPRLRPRRRRQRRARPTGTSSTSSTDGDKENRPPHPAPSSPSSPSPSPPPRRRRRAPCGARRPLLCSTPHGLGPGPAPGPALGPSPALGDSPPAGRLSELLLSTTIEQGLGPGLLPPRRRRPLRPLPPSSPEEPQESQEPQEPEEQCPPPPSSPQLPSEPPEPCPPPLLPPSSPSSPSAEPDVPHPGPAARPAPPQDAAPQPPGTPEEPRGGPRTGRSAKGGSSSPPGPAREQRVMVPVVVLDRGEVARMLAGMRQGRRDGARAARPQPGSPVGQRGGVPENKPQRMQGAPGEGSACRRACISGSSASRWRTLRPKRRKLKRQKQQQPENCFSRARARQKPAREGVLEMSAEVRGNDSSFLNSSCTWVRVRASLSFHKKKKVTTEDSFCSSILSTPSGKSPMSGYQASLSSGKTQGHSWCASSMVLLAPSGSSSVLELMLTDAEKVFGECCQEGPIAFEECIPLDKMKNCKKIGEGVFGEVFQVKSERGPVALKIIPIEGTEKVNGEAQKSFGEILPEVIISKELSLLSEESVNRTVGFISLYSVHCVQGAYPKYLLKAWDKYHKETGSENDRPDFFGDDQLFMVLEFEFGGSDLEHMRHSLSSVAAARSILHQVTASLAVAEQELHFEHRDLHWGNVLVKKTDVKALHYVLNGAPHRIPTAGIHVNIIDYTLSRLEKDGLTVFCDLASEEELFQGTGDYQFDIYRQMKAENSNSWTGYHPHSNVLWLHYLADKLLHGVTYKNKASSSGLKNIKMQLTKFHKEVLSFKSAHDVLQNSSLFQ